MPENIDKASRERDDIIEDLSAKCESIFEKASGSHDWDHTWRVRRLCERIGRVEGADMMVLQAAALLHDIGRCDQDRMAGRVCHAERGAEMARLMVEPLPLTEAQKTNIYHCIRAHRFRDDHPPSTIEAKILFDADKLDAIGAIGIARAYLFAGEVGARLHNPNNNIDNTQPYTREDTGYREFMVKLRKIKDHILTEEGRKIAADRHDYMVLFFKRFLEEYDGGR